MGVPLVAILGAGASRGSGEYKARLRPPLTVNLFDEDVYGEQLRLYDLAHQAGRLIEQERSQDDALALERVLREMRESSFPHHRHMALAVPLYLQHLLYAVSVENYAQARRYDRLIERLLRLPYVCFMTLNYDVLLDRRLSGHRRLASLDDYISPEENWSLIKLHGSVNWWHPATEPFIASAPPRDLEWIDSEFFCALPDMPLESIRGGPPDSSIQRYPALAMPEGAGDRLVLPDKHRWFVNNRLKSESQIDLLVIGYSGLDTEVLSLLASLNCKVRRMTVVNRNGIAAEQVLTRFRAAGIDPIWPKVVLSDFAEWAGGDGLNGLVDEYDGPYSD